MPRVGPQSPTAAAAAWFVPPIITEIEQPGDAASRGREGVVIEPDLRERLVARVDVHMDLQRDNTGKGTLERELQCTSQQGKLT
jgi:hypothetical protein